MNWQPSASLAMLQQRAIMYRDIRDFFAKRQVMEVETPCLASAGVTDLHLDNFVTQMQQAHPDIPSALYLQTSPEYAMKRLLCAGSGAIFQIAKAFRNESAGRFHNPEFTMLEWYRPGFDDHALIDEVDELLQQLLECEPAERITYQQASQTYLEFDPLEQSLQRLKGKAASLGYDDIAEQESDPDTLLQLLFAMHIEPHLGHQRPCVVYDFPASQAALARISSNDPRVAHRFEVYCRGIELANGFYELSDPVEQRRRFEQDNQKRKRLQKPAKPVDEYLLAALESGLPECAGVALGLDRLMMLISEAESIEQVMSFSIYNA